MATNTKIMTLTVSTAAATGSAWAGAQADTCETTQKMHTARQRDDWRSRVRLTSS